MRKLLSLCIIAVTSCSVPTPTPTSIPPISTPVPYLSVDDLAGASPAVNCSPFHKEEAIEQMGYCLYFDNAKAELSQVSWEDGSQSLRIAYALPPAHEWGNWLSIRRETAALTDLSAHIGLSLRLRIEEPADTILRLTLADVMSAADAGVKGRDELWWCDREGVLNSPPGEWQTVTCPFADFREASGEGTRHNDHSLDLARIVAYEINIISAAGAHPAGVIVVDSLVAYK
jgi:hypothetical protein